MQKYNFLKNVYKTLKFRNPIILQYRNYTLAQKGTTCCFKYKINKIGCQSYLNINHFVQTDSSKCWNCGVNRNSITELVCDKCNVIQQPHNTENYFKVFDIEEEFDVDQKSLTVKYRRLQSVLHPDKYSNKSNEEKTISADYSALVNEAYNTLQVPLKRAIHMLKLKGEKIEEDQKVTDPEFLMEIMELNEEVEEASSPDQLKKLNEENKNVLIKIGTEFSNHFKKNQLEKAKDTAVKMKYYNSVSLHINGLLRERGIVD